MILLAHSWSWQHKHSWLKQNKFWLLMTVMFTKVLLLIEICQILASETGDTMCGIPASWESAEKRRGQWLCCCFGNMRGICRVKTVSFVAKSGVTLKRKLVRQKQRQRVSVRMGDVAVGAYGLVLWLATFRSPGKHICDHETQLPWGHLYLGKIHVFIAVCVQRACCYFCCFFLTFITLPRFGTNFMSSKSFQCVNSYCDEDHV